MLFEQFSNQMHERYRQLTLAQKMQDIPPFLFIEFIAEQLKSIDKQIMESWDFYGRNQDNFSWSQVKEWSLNHHNLRQVKAWLEALAVTEIQEG